VPYVIDQNLGYILKSKYIINNKNMKKLEGKVAVFTGGNSGIGLAAEQQFVLEGHRYRTVCRWRYGTNLRDLV
jgi:hypothetical protein